MNGVTYIDNFLVAHDAIYDHLLANVDWDDRMTVRKTASYGMAYNYSQMSYPYRPFFLVLEDICRDLVPLIGFAPNNCLINYYPDGSSRMGFHSDQTDILEDDTDIAIVSLGTMRTLRFRNIADRSLIHDIDLSPGSLFCMNQQVQHEWQHAVLASDTKTGRISLTFRRMRPDTG